MLPPEVGRHSSVILKVIDSEGQQQQFAFTSPRTSFGSDSKNEVQLAGPGISAVHCAIVLDNQNYVLRDRGSTNGTFINNRRCREPTILHPGDRIDIGSFQVELMFQSEASNRDQAHPFSANSFQNIEKILSGSIVRPQSPKHKWLTKQERYEQFAQEWRQSGRSNHLLTGKEIERAIDWLHEATSIEGCCPSTTQQEWILTAVRRQKNRKLGFIIGATATPLVSALAILYALGREPEPDLEAPEDAIDRHGPETHLEDDVVGEAPAPQPKKHSRTWIDHHVIPAETLRDIAIRYDVSIHLICQWNGLNIDQPRLYEDQILKIKPRKKPLRQQKINYEVERGDTFKGISERFEVPVMKLRAYNPHAPKKPKAGEHLAIWVDPKPLERQKSRIAIPELSFSTVALSEGRTNAGHLINGIQFPAGDFYKRRAPYKMYGSSQLIKWLWTAMATFRRDYGFRGDIVIADISLPNGGHFPPHKSHQSGRDVDIWLPTLKGVYKKSHLGADRRPEPDEADWFATWHMVESLLATNQIQAIFLTYELQERVYNAALLSGASEEQLRDMIQFPHGHTSAPLRHSDNHTHHIHVRFICGPNDRNCR